MAFLRIEKSGDDPLFEVLLDPDEHALLYAIPDRLRRILTDPETSPKVVDRLFPPAHRDPGQQEEHRVLIGKSLYEERLSSLRTFKDTLHRARGKPFKIVKLDAEGARLWLHVVNDFRLLLATSLGIEDNDWHDHAPDDPDAYQDFALLEHLTHLQQTLLDAVL